MTTPRDPLAAYRPGARVTPPFDLAAYREVRDRVETELRAIHPDDAAAPWVHREASRYAREFVAFLLPDDDGSRARRRRARLLRAPLEAVLKDRAQRPTSGR